MLTEKPCCTRHAEEVDSRVSDSIVLNTVCPEIEFVQDQNGSEINNSRVHKTPVFHVFSQIFALIFFFQINRNKIF